MHSSEYHLTPYDTTPIPYNNPDYLDIWEDKLENQRVQPNTENFFQFLNSLPERVREDFVEEEDRLIEERVIEIMNFFLSKGNIRFGKKFGVYKDTLLHAAAAKGSGKMLEILLKKDRTALNQGNSNSTTPLMTAVHRLNSAAVRVLLNQKDIKTAIPSKEYFYRNLTAKEILTKMNPTLDRALTSPTEINMQKFEQAQSDYNTIVEIFNKRT